MTDSSWILKTIEKEAEARAFSNLLRDSDTSALMFFGMPYGRVMKMLRFVEKHIGKPMQEITDEDLVAK